MIKNLYEMLFLGNDHPSDASMALIGDNLSFTYEQLSKDIVKRIDEFHSSTTARYLKIRPSRDIHTILTVLAAFEAKIPFEITSDIDEPWITFCETPWKAEQSGYLDVAYVMSTSGSSGVAKQTVVTRQGLTTVFTGLQKLLGHEIPSESTWTQSHALTFGFSMCEILGCISFKGTLIMVDRLDSLKLNNIVDAIRGIKNSVVCLTPSELNILSADNPENLPSHFMLSGEPLHRLSNETIKRLSGQDAPRVINTYAATETSGQVTVHLIAPEDWEMARRGYVGTVLPEVNVMIIDEAGHSIRRGDTEKSGEIFVLGDSVAAGYLHDSKRTSESFGSNPQTWYRTGDTGCWAPDGRGFFVLGRSSRIVKVGRSWVDMDDLERNLQCVDGVLQVAVTLVSESSFDSHEDWLNVLCQGTEFNLARNVRQKISELFQSPLRVRVEVTSEIERTENGKLSRRSVPAKTLAPFNSGISEVILGTWRDILGDGIEPDTHVFAEGLDSIGIISFIERLNQRLGLDVPVRFVLDNPRVADQLATLAVYKTLAPSAGIVSKRIRASRAKTRQEFRKSKLEED